MAKTALRATLGRGYWIVVDQAISSLSNFLLIVLVGRSLGAAALGTFTLVYAGWLIVFGINRALVVDPMLIQGESTFHSGAYLSASMIVASGSAAVSAAAAVAVGIGTNSGRTIAALAVFLPALVLQEMWRRLGFLREVPRRSALNDAVFLLIQLMTLVVIVRIGRFSTATAVAAWGVGALAGACFGFTQFPVRVESWRSGVRMLVAGRTLSAWLALDFALNRWARQAALYLTAAVLSPAAVGAIQASVNMLGPTNILNFGASAAALADGGNRLRQDGHAAMRRVVWLNGAVLAAVVVLYAVIYTMFASEILVRVYGRSFARADVAAPWIALAIVLYSVDTVPMVRLRLARKTKRLFSIRLIATPVTLGATWFLASTAGLTGAAAGYATVALGLTGGAWIAFLLSTQRDGVAGSLVSAEAEGKSTSSPLSTS